MFVIFGRKKRWRIFLHDRFDIRQLGNLLIDLFSMIVVIRECSVDLGWGQRREIPQESPRQIIHDDNFAQSS